MTRPEALALLHLTDPTAKLAPQAAFRALASDLTSDRWGRGPKPTIDALREARDILLNSPEPAKLPCQICRGRGKISTGFHIATCPTCRGTGEQS